jgi:hypothetical protein
MKLPEWCLIDSNVPILANGTEDVDLSTVADSCINVLMEVMGRGGLVLDEGDRVFDEYRDNLRLSGQPGLGDMFMKWVHDNRWNDELCQRVQITCLDESNQVFAEFPSDDELDAFDVDDRKFVAVANAHATKAPIVQAVDYKWWGWKDALKRVGIQVLFVDPNLAKQKYREHIGHE